MDLTVHANVNDEARPLRHFWSVCVGAGRANEGLRAGWLEHLALAARECGFRYVRFHGLFYEDMFVYRKIKGQDVYNWQYVDDVFDRMLDLGVRPFVELGFCPEDMGDGSPSNLYWKYKSIIPGNMAEWGKLISKTVEHWIARYGAEEVRQWYFEVWNEPNLDGFFSGTKSMYFELYKTSVIAIKGVDSLLRVGGPATSNFVPDERFCGEREDTAKITIFDLTDIDAADWRPVWLEDFLCYCDDEKLPVDFVSTHPYPTDFALSGHGTYHGFSRSVNSTRDDLHLVRKIVDESAYPNAEIHLTEWSSSPSSRDSAHDSLTAAAFIVKTNLDSAGLVDSLSYWTFTDVFEEEGGGESIFHGGFGMINYQGIVKPSFHAYRFLHGLGDSVIARQDGCVVTKDLLTGRIAALAYNYPESEVPQSLPISERDGGKIAWETLRKGSSKSVCIKIEGLAPNAPFVIETLDEHNGFALAAYRRLGSPESPDREQTKLLRNAAMATKKEYLTAGANGRLTVELDLKPWVVVFIREL